MTQKPLTPNGLRKPYLITLEDDMAIVMVK